MNSKEKLVKALTEYKEQYKGETVIADNITRMLSQMIARAKEGYYSDYDSPIALPCIQLVTDLTEIGATDLVNRAKNGEFDATKEESNAWYEREGKAMIEKELPKEMWSMFKPKSEEEQESKEGIKGWDI